MAESNSVYLTYRRGVGELVARAIFQDLRAHDVDVFMDVEQMRGEQTETIFLNQIAARPYSLLVVTPGTLEPAAEPGDWLRTQLEHALHLGRQIVPIVSPHVRFGDVQRILPDSLGAALAHTSPVNVRYNAFPEALSKLRIHRLKPLDLPLTPTPEADREIIVRAMENAESAARVIREHLLAQDHLEKAFLRRPDDTEGRIKDYSEAIRLYPEFAEAYARRAANREILGYLNDAMTDADAAIQLKPYNAIAYVNRGNIRSRKDDIAGAIEDYSSAIQLEPQLAAAYYNRGRARAEIDYLDGAIADFTEAIRLNREFAPYYYRRALAYLQKEAYAEAIEDFTETIRLQPDLAEAYYNRGLAHAQIDLQAAVADWSEAIRLNPEFVEAYYNRGLVRANWADLEGTIEDMSRVLELVPDSPQARAVRARLEDLKRLKGSMGGQDAAEN